MKDNVPANNAIYYYHFNGLGSVVALSDSNGDTVQTYEYSVYGQVAAEDPEFLTNPYMFTGRRFDIETGLYYYHARYYNPHIGRFMQTDPVGYGAGMNLYAYCGNGPLNFVDPSGLYSVKVKIPLQTIWHGSSMGAIIKGKYVTEENDPQHKKDVQSFFDESNFFGEFPGVTLESVTFYGSHEEGTYKCVFEVPDEYENMKMDIEEEVEGIPILVVKTGPWFNKSETQILDWRLIGMLNDPMYYESHRVEWLVTGVVTQTFAAVNVGIAYVNRRAGNALKSVKVIVPGSLFVIAEGASVLSFYMVVTDPGANVPNFDKWQGYYDYISSFDGGLDSMFDRYEEYKKRYKL